MLFCKNSCAPLIHMEISCHLQKPKVQKFLFRCKDQIRSDHAAMLVLGHKCLAAALVTQFWKQLEPRLFPYAVIRLTRRFKTPFPGFKRRTWWQCTCKVSWKHSDLQRTNLNIHNNFLILHHVVYNMKLKSSSQTVHFLHDVCQFRWRYRCSFTFVIEKICFHRFVANLS